MNAWSLGRYYLSVPGNWLQLTLHNTWGILNVLDIIWLRPMPGGLLDAAHPFCTGVNPATGQPIWPTNVIFRTPPRRTWRADQRPPEDDDTLVQKVGEHLARQVRFAAARAEHPTGQPAPMPPGCAGWSPFAPACATNPRSAPSQRRTLRSSTPLAPIR